MCNYKTINDNLMSTAFRNYVEWENITEKFKIKRSNLEEFENELDNYQNDYKSND